MIDTLNTVAMAIGYVAMGCGVLWFLNLRRKDRLADAARQNQRDNEARDLEYKRRDPQGWRDRETRREGAQRRNANRRDQIERLKTEMENEF